MSRQAAAAAHASYYAHPALHLHTYLSKDGSSSAISSQHEGSVIGGMNEAYVPPVPSKQPEGLPEAGKRDVKTDAGVKEEEGGKDDAGQPSGKDKGALEINGEAGGTLTSPGPSKQDIENYHPGARANGIHANGVAVDPSKLSAEQQRPNMERFWSVRQKMEPHLQLMYDSLMR